MTKAQLLAAAATISALVAGGSAGVYFLSASTGQVTTLPAQFGAFEVVDRTLCSVSVCNAAPCVQARNILADAGQSATTPMFVECVFRVGAGLRNRLADAGTLINADKYQQLKLVALRNGSVLGIPVDDAGWPVYAVATGTPGCKMRPLGAACTRNDGGDQGDLNQQASAELTGAGCAAVACGSFAGDPP